MSATRASGHRAIARPVLAALLVLAASPRAPAQAAAATKHVKLEAKAELQALKQDFAVAVNQFDTAIDAVEESLVEGGAPLVEGAQAVLDAWAAAQQSLHDALAVRWSGMLGDAAAELLSYQFETGGETAPYPKGFHPGDGGGLDIFERGWRKELALAEAKLQTRLLKLKKRLGKELDVSVGVQVRAAAFEVGYLVNASSSSAPTETSNTASLGLDLLLTLDPAVSTLDGIVLLSGTGHPDVLVTVTLSGSLGMSSYDTTDVPGDTLRWAVLFEGVQEGNYEVTVLEGEDGPIAGGGVGVG